MWGRISGWARQEVSASLQESLPLPQEDLAALPRLRPRHPKTSTTTQLPPQPFLWPRRTTVSRRRQAGFTPTPAQHPDTPIDHSEDASNIDRPVEYQHEESAKGDQTLNADVTGMTTSNQEVKDTKTSNSTVKDMTTANADVKEKTALNQEVTDTGTVNQGVNDTITSSEEVKNTATPGGKSSRKNNKSGKQDQTSTTEMAQESPPPGAQNKGPTNSTPAEIANDDSGTSGKKKRHPRTQSTQENKLRCTKIQISAEAQEAPNNALTKIVSNDKSSTSGKKRRIAPTDSTQSNKCSRTTKDESAQAKATVRRLRASAAKPKPSELPGGNDLDELKLANRSPDMTCGINFPVELLMLLAEIYDKHDVTGVKVKPKGSASPGDSIYHFQEENNLEAPHYKASEVATASIEAATELALCQFRNLCSKHFPGLRFYPSEEELYFHDDPITSIEDWADGVWVKGSGLVSELGRLAWWVDDKDCVSLSAWMPGTEGQLVVRVAPMKLVIG